ncbi:3-hydroxyisobutyrate dehydrogenase [Paracoccus sp. (in: a-proteobacteria)]|uniref:3-hydroxyisobutyrate dehydrogenase n=1 Tax=Paracoccus sp. TaxID=267 RepID=UPI003A83BDF6
MAAIGFVGLGTMGAPMAQNLLRAGHRLRVHDVTGANLKVAVEAGATACTEPHDVLKDAEFVVTMLPNGQVVSDVLGGQGGLFARCGGGLAPLFIDCSTIAPDTARALAAEAGAQGRGMIDAPVSGGVERARDATLAIMVGGGDADFARAKPILANMSRVAFHAGPAGAGQSAKVCNNMLAAVIMAGTAEALSLGERLGLDVNVLTRIIGKSSGGSFLIENWNPYPGVTPAAPASRNYDNGFQLQLMLKDLGLALDSAQGSQHPAPMGAVAQSLYMMKQQTEQGAAIKDFSKIVDLFRAGIPGSGY